MESEERLTTADILIGDNQTSLTAGLCGLLLLRDWQLFGERNTIGEKHDG